MDQEYVARGTALRVARVRAGMTLGDAASAVGCDGSHLSRIERGQRRASESLAMALCELYQVAMRSIWRSARGVELVPERVSER